MPLEVAVSLDVPAVGTGRKRTARFTRLRGPRAAAKPSCPFEPDPYGEPGARTAGKCRYVVDATVELAGLIRPGDMSRQAAPESSGDPMRPHHARDLLSARRPSRAARPDEEHKPCTAQALQLSREAQGQAPLS